MYNHILSTFYGSFWCILPERLMEIEAYLRSRHSGEEFAAAMQAAQDRPPFTKAGDVAVLPIHGTVYPRGGANPMSGGTTAERISRSVTAAANDKDVSSIVLDIDSPGGAVAGVPEAAAAIREAAMRKPVHAVANHMAASAAYWLGSQATTFSASPSAMVGSIGVVRRHVDETGAIEKEGLKVTTIATAKHKTEGYSTSPITDETAAYMLGEAQKIHGRFVGDVASGRGTTVENVNANYGQGRVLMADEAKMLGMIDRVATLDQVVAMARENSKMRDRMRARAAMAAF